MIGNIIKVFISMIYNFFQNNFLLINSLWIDIKNNLKLQIIPPHGLETIMKACYLIKKFNVNISFQEWRRQFGQVCPRDAPRKRLRPLVWQVLLPVLLQEWQSRSECGALVGWCASDRPHVGAHPSHRLEARLRWGGPLCWQDEVRGWAARPAKTQMGIQQESKCVFSC